MPDIFISYSSHDREQAELLTELLASAGLSVWIDQSGIGAATSWSEEIVNALDGCKAFIVMLSPSSIESKNVVRELALAFEKNKKILPLDLEPVSLPASMQYHLAGLQRTSMTNIDSIIRALGKLGLEATGAPKAPKIVKDKSDKKSLMILPFEDLSPTGDNGWFADGIASELISALSNVKALRVADPQATKDFKGYKGQLALYAKEMSIQYFVQGDVRKFGDNIKITCRLLDIESGDFLWQESLKGTMNDVFEIQEEVAKKVTEGLNIVLTREEKKKLAERGTENTEAYELYLKANEYSDHQTKEGFQLSAQLHSEAIRLDPSYAEAYSKKANVLAGLYRNYSGDPALLEEAYSLIHEALRLKSDLWSAYKPLAFILTLQGKLEEAEQTAKDYLRNAPDDYLSHFTLGFFYQSTDRAFQAIGPYEASLKLEPANLHVLYNLVLACNRAMEENRQKRWSEVALPVFEKHLKLFPSSENHRVSQVMLLHYASRDDEAKEAALKLLDLRDGVSLFKTATLHSALGNHSLGLGTFRKSLDAGFRGMENIKYFLIDEDEGIGMLKGTPEYEEVKRMVEKIEAEATSG